MTLLSIGESTYVSGKSIDRFTSMYVFYVKFLPPVGPLNPLTNGKKFVGKIQNIHRRRDTAAKTVRSNRKYLDTENKS